MFRNATDFCVLIFYPATLANSVMSCSHFLAAYLEFSMFSIMSSMNGGNLISLFLIWIYTFLMIAMVRTFNAMFTMLKKKKSGERGRPCHVPYHRGNSSAIHQ